MTLLGLVLRVEGVVAFSDTERCMLALLAFLETIEVRVTRSTRDVEELKLMIVLEDAFKLVIERLASPGLGIELLRC